MNTNQKLVNFMHFHNLCTPNNDHFILLIKTGNAREERILPQTTINTFKSVRGEGLKSSQK